MVDNVSFPAPSSFLLLVVLEVMESYIGGAWEQGYVCAGVLEGFSLPLKSAEDKIKKDRW